MYYLTGSITIKFNGKLYATNPQKYTVNVATKKGEAQPITFVPFRRDEQGCPVLHEFQIKAMIYQSSVALRFTRKKICIKRDLAFIPHEIPIPGEVETVQYYSKKDTLGKRLTFVTGYEYINQPELTFRYQLIPESPFTVADLQKCFEHGCHLGLGGLRKSDEGKFQLLALTLDEDTPLMSDGDDDKEMDDGEENSADRHIDGPASTETAERHAPADVYMDDSAHG